MHVFKFDTFILLCEELGLFPIAGDSRHFLFHVTPNV